MEVFNHTIAIPKRRDEVKIVCMGCIHYGATGCDEELAQFWLDKVLADDNTFLILGGDLVDGITEKDKRYKEEEVARWCFDKKWGGTVADRQYHYAAAKLKPLAEAGKILWIHTGNHEQALKTWASRDLTLDWSRELGVTYAGYSALVNLRIHDETQSSAKSFEGYMVSFYSTHGAGAAQSDGGIINRAAGMLANYDTDVAIMWHLHRRMHVLKSALRPSRPNRGLPPGICVRDRVAAVCGTFLRGSTEGCVSYSEVKGYPPVALGPSVLHIKLHTVSNETEGPRKGVRGSAYVRIWVSDAIRIEETAS